MACAIVTNWGNILKWTSPNQKDISHYEIYRREDDNTAAITTADVIAKTFHITNSETPYVFYYDLFTAINTTKSYWYWAKSVAYDGQRSTADHVTVTADRSAIIGLPDGADTNEPSGFPNRTDSDLSWDDGTRTLSISPTATSFDYYIKGQRFTVTAADTIVPTNTTGTTLIYYDSATLTEVNSPSDAQVETAIEEKALVAILYWNTAQATKILFADERHGITMDGKTHHYLHDTVGLAYDDGLALVNFTADQTGADDEDAQFGHNAGSAYDEDLEISAAAVASTVGLPIWYRSGAGGPWVSTTNAGFSVITAAAGTRLVWNEDVAGTWQLTEVNNNQFVLCHVFMTNDVDNQMIAIIGQADYGNLASAQTGATTEINSLLLGSLPGPEMRPIGTIIFQTGAYGNQVNARVRSVAGGGDYIDWRTATIAGAGVAVSDHGSLSGLSDDDHTQYVINDGTRGAQSVSANLTLGGDFFVCGALTVSSTVTFGDTLSVSGVSSFNNNVNISGILTVSTLNVTAAASVQTTLHVSGATTLGDSLTVSGIVTINNNTNISGALTVSTLSVTGAASVQNTLHVSGAVTFGDSLTVSGVSSFNNNVNISGALTVSTLNVTGSASVQNTLHVSGAVTFGDSLTISGIVSINNNIAITGTATIDGITIINDTLTVSGAVSLSTTLHVCGAATFNDTVTIESALTVNDEVIISGNLTVGGNTLLSGTLTVTGAVSLSSTLLVAGEATFNDGITVESAAIVREYMELSAAAAAPAGPGTNAIRLYAAETTSGTKLLYVDSAGTSYQLPGAGGGNDSFFEYNQSAAVDTTGGDVTIVFNTAYFTVTTGTGTCATVSLTGNLVIDSLSVSGTLSVCGQTTFSDNVIISGTLTVSGDTTISGDLNVGTNICGAGTLEIAGAVTLDGTTTINDNLVVSGSSTLQGAVTISGGLTVSGAITLDGTTINDGLIVSGTTSLGGNTTISGTLTVSGATTIGALVVSGTSTLNGAVTISGNVTVSGNTSLNGTLTVSGITSLQGATTVSGGLTTNTLVVTATLSVCGTTTLGGATTIDNTLEVSGVATFDNNIIVSGTATIDGQLNANGGLVVSGTSTLNGGLTVSGNVTVSGDTSLNGTLTVSGTTTLAATTINGGLTISSGLTVSGTTTLNGAVTISGNVTVTGTTTFGGITKINSTLTVSGAVTFESTLSVSGAVTLNGTALTSIKLDDWNTPDDNTDLNATSTYHGLCPKLSNVASEYLNGQGAWTTPAGGGNAIYIEENANPEWNTSVSDGYLNFGPQFLLTTVLGNSSTVTIGDPLTLGAVNATSMVVTGALTVSGGATISGGLIVCGTTSLGGNTTISGTLTVSGTTTIGALVVSGTSTLNGAVNISGNLTVSGNTSLNGTLTVSSTTTVYGQLNANGAFVCCGTATFQGTGGGNFIVCGLATFGGTTFHVSGAATFGETFAVSGVATFNGAIKTSANISVTGERSLTMQTNITSAFTFYDDAGTPIEYLRFDSTTGSALVTVAPTFAAEGLVRIGNNAVHNCSSLTRISNASLENTKKYSLYVDLLSTPAAADTSDKIGIGGYTVLNNTNVNGACYGLQFGPYVSGTTGGAVASTTTYGIQTWGARSYNGTFRTLNNIALDLNHWINDTAGVFQAANSYGLMIRDSAVLGTGGYITNQYQAYFYAPTKGTNNYQLVLAGTNTASCGLWFNGVGGLHIGATASSYLYVNTIPQSTTTTDPLYWDSTNGTIHRVTSSKRFKKNIEPYDCEWSKILEVQPKTFTGLGGEKYSLGYIAEEIEELGLDYLVNYDKDGLPESLNYMNFSIYAIEMIKKQQKQINELRKILCDKKT